MDDPPEDRFRITVGGEAGHAPAVRSTRAMAACGPATWRRKAASRRAARASSSARRAETFTPRYSPASVTRILAAITPKPNV